MPGVYMVLVRNVMVVAHRVFVSWTRRLRKGLSASRFAGVTATALALADLDPVVAPGQAKFTRPGHRRRPVGEKGKSQVIDSVDSGNADVNPSLVGSWSEQFLFDKPHTQ
jgi:hypothetical protein